MPWIDEVKNFYTPSISYFSYDVGIDGIILDVSPIPTGYFLLTYRDDNLIKVNNNKNYKFKHLFDKTLSGSSVVKVNHFLEDDVSLYSRDTSTGPVINIDEDVEIGTGGPSQIYTCYSYYNSLNDKEVNNTISYWLNELNSNAQPHYIKSVEVEEIDFFINGYKNSEYNSEGWSYDNGEYSYKNTDIYTPPVWLNGFDNESFIGSKILYNNFNWSFDYDLSSLPSGFEINGYLIDSLEFEKWRTNSSNFIFDDIDKITSINISSLATNQTLSGVVLDSRNKYFVIRLSDYKDVEFKIRNIKITGGYSDENNVLTPSIPSSTTSDISFEYNDGTNIQTSFIGNGKFLSGVWENGVWNNGVRTDSDSFEFNDVLNSYPISDGKWRIEISKSSLLSSNETSLIGEYVSIGNIVVININEERKFLKNSYLVVDAFDNYIVIEAEFSFPVRRIERDSDKHRMKVSKNVWLSGAFLNGRFEGIWNNGVFKGNAFNNVMDNTQWIDGLFDGGRFKSNYSITGTFSNISVLSSEINNILYAKLSVFGLTSSPLVGDIINITNSDNYNGDSTLLEVVQIGSEYSITIDKNYIVDTTTPIESNLTLLISDGLVQNFTFNDNNISKLTTTNTDSSSTIFKYNSWIDVNYDRNEAVNLGREIKLYDDISQKNVPKNNLYGYPTSDVLSSISKFRDSNTLNSKFYKLGSKYKIFTDFLGDSSLFNDPFNTDSSSTFDDSYFYDAGWTFSKNSGLTSSINFERTYPGVNTLGKELKISTIDKGGVLNNSKINIEKNRYSVIKFESIEISKYDIYYLGNTFSSQITESVVGGNSYPVLNFSNINKKEESSYLPVSKNVNSLSTPNKRKMEYFFNKTELNMNILSYGDFDDTEKFELTIDNLKMYEVDMIPFFKYFNESNIFKGIQKPLVGTSPFIEYTLNRFPFVESQSIPFDSIDIKTKE